MRGRRPSGPEYVSRLDGSEQAKQRLEVVLQTLAGTCRVQEACRLLGISEPRFHQLRTQLLQAALERLEPRPTGRPPQPEAAEPQQVAALTEQLAEQDVELRAAQARAEIALTLPAVLQQPPTEEKKTRPPTPPPPRRRRRRGTRKPT